MMCTQSFIFFALQWLLFNLSDDVHTVWYTLLHKNYLFYVLKIYILSCIHSSGCILVISLVFHLDVQELHGVRAVEVHYSLYTI
jgi:hypothetical protein